jgi:hypothetical protein
MLVTSRHLARRPGWIVTAALVVAAVAAAPAAAQQPTLTGEILTQHIFYEGPTSGICSTDPQTGTTSYSFDFAGFAVGPFQGTFTEHIDVTIGPPGAPLPMGPFPDGFTPGSPGPSDFIGAGQLLSFVSQFHIDALEGEVSGNKSLAAIVPADSQHAGACQEFEDEPSQFGTLNGGYKDVRAFDLVYDAEITTLAGTFEDEGTSEAQGRQGRIDNEGGNISNVNDFAENFQSNQDEEERTAQHFRAYRATGAAATLERMTLVDQFGSAVIRLGPVRWLMTPAGKAREGHEPEPIQRPAEHLRCYRIGGPAANRTVTISNQFTESTVVTVGDPTDLCAPASASLEGDPGEPPADLNHYKCYAVSRTPSVAEDVQLTDQVVSEQVRVQRLSRLCNPVEKRRTGRAPELPPHPTEHLACYQLREPAGSDSVSVFTQDQFRSEVLEVSKPSRLCVPSTKTEGGGV